MRPGLDESLCQRIVHCRANMMSIYLWMTLCVFLRVNDTVHCGYSMLLRNDFVYHLTRSRLATTTIKFKDRFGLVP